MLYVTWSYIILKLTCSEKKQTQKENKQTKTNQNHTDFITLIPLR